MLKKHFLEVQTCITLLVVIVAASAWHITDERIRERRHFCEVQNTTTESETIILNAEGLLNDKLRVSTPWDEDPRAQLILHKALIEDLDVRAVLLREGFTRIIEGNFEIKIPPMPNLTHHEIKKNTKPESNPYPIES